MGLDAEAVFNRDSPKEKKRVFAAFKVASKKVQEKSGSVDGALSLGYLDVSTCVHMLERAAELAGLNWNLAWRDEGMEHKYVHAMRENVTWLFSYPDDEAWAYWSAVHFLETCDDLGLGIIFTH
jgi:hypothetical protein